jgi:hypothetical protein
MSFSFNNCRALPTIYCHIHLRTSRALQLHDGRNTFCTNVSNWFKSDSAAHTRTQMAVSQAFLIFREKSELKSGKP